MGPRSGGKAFVPARQPQCPSCRYSSAALTLIGIADKILYRQNEARLQVVEGAPLEL